VTEARENFDPLEFWIRNKSRELKMKAHDLLEWKIWVNSIAKVIHYSPWGPNGKFRYGSFAPQRLNNFVKYFIDGDSYFETLYDRLSKAVKQVFITDWWLTPELFLKRPVSFESKNHQKFRIDNILGRLANEGVKIFIIIYKEVSVGFYHNSAHTMMALQNMHENIKVLRHPRTFISLWSHHEKI
jgi:phosphatidylserine/phosphatidylglycerophosphate/cardiolipin synthase-like enzyme